MMGLGMIDNCCLSYISLVLGFEFKSKIAPFGKAVSALTVVIVRECTVLSSPKTHEFRPRLT